MYVAGTCHHVGIDIRAPPHTAVSGEHHSPMVVTGIILSYLKCYCCGVQFSHKNIILLSNDDEARITVLKQVSVVLVRGVDKICLGLTARNPRACL